MPMPLEELLPWGPLTAAALFLGGLGGGSFIVAAVTSFISGERFREIMKFGAYVGVLATALCGLLELMHAGHPEHILFMYSNTASMMTFGATVTTATLLVGLIYATFLPPDSLPWLKSFLPWSIYVKPRKFFEAVLFLLGVGLASYSGLEFSVAWAEPFWSTPLIVVLFFLSAVSTALMAIGLCIAILRLIQVTEESRTLFTEMLHSLNKANICMLVLELLTAASYLHIMSTGPSKIARESAALLLSGTLMAPFWGGFIIVGLVIPIALSALLAWRGRAEAYVKLYAPLMILVSVLVLVGGFYMRYCFLAAGQMPVLK